MSVFQKVLSSNVAFIYVSVDWYSFVFGGYLVSKQRGVEWIDLLVP